MTVDSLLGPFDPGNVPGLVEAVDAVTEFVGDNMSRTGAATTAREAVAAATGPIIAAAFADAADEMANAGERAAAFYLDHLSYEIRERTRP